MAGAQTPETTLQLGDFVFGALEIPGEINFGGAQRLAVHQLVGGVKVVDAMGRSDDPIAWSGMLLGGGKDISGNAIFSGAVDRAQYLDQLRIAGQPLDLTWGRFKYRVVVREFKGSYQKSYLIPYHITVEVIQDETSPVSTAGAPPIDSAIGDDDTAATVLVTTIGDPTLTGYMGSISAAIAAVVTFATAPQSQINGVLQPIVLAQGQVSVLAAAATATIGGATAFGGLVPGAPAATSATQMSAQVAAMTQLSNLRTLGSILGRMQRNLSSAKSSPRTVATAGGNLFRIAEEQYGEAAAWTGIAQANGLTDPFIQGTKVLQIPPVVGDTTGILSS
jgi:hypothetical protein